MAMQCLIQLLKLFITFFDNALFSFFRTTCHETALRGILCADELSEKLQAEAMTQLGEMRMLGKRGSLSGFLPPERHERMNLWFWLRFCGG